MKKAPLYSSSRPSAQGSEPPRASDSPPVHSAAPESALPTRRSRLRALVARHTGPVWALAGALLVAGGMLLQHARSPAGVDLTQRDIDAAVRSSLEKEPLPSPYARAYAAVLPSVVRVVGLDGDDPAPKPTDADVADAADPRAHRQSTGSGVVIMDNGTILTNLHVVAGAKRIRVTFWNGHESEATLLNAQPQNDLAVLRAKSIPDDLAAATMASTGGLAVGDQVLAVGFPFGIGPSASGGVVSGLKRQFRSPEGGQRLTNLIQFDAAANSGNSGGPLVTMDGSVIGIVTAILNPGDAGTFIGIAFAVPIENAASAAGMPPC